MEKLVSEQPVKLAFWTSPEDSAHRRALFKKYGRWVSPAEHRLREQAAALGFSVVRSDLPIDRKG